MRLFYLAVSHVRLSEYYYGFWGFHYMPSGNGNVQQAVDELSQNAVKCQQIIAQIIQMQRMSWLVRGWYWLINWQNYRVNTHMLSFYFALQVYNREMSAVPSSHELKKMLICDRFFVELDQSSIDLLDSSIVSHLSPAEKSVLQASFQWVTQSEINYFGSSPHNSFIIRLTTQQISPNVPDFLRDDTSTYSRVLSSALVTYNATGSYLPEFVQIARQIARSKPIPVTLDLVTILFNLGLSKTEGEFTSITEVENAYQQRRSASHPDNRSDRWSKFRLIEAGYAFKAFNNIFSALDKHNSSLQSDSDIIADIIKKEADLYRLPSYLRLLEEQRQEHSSDAFTL